MFFLGKKSTNGHFSTSMLAYRRVPHFGTQPYFWHLVPWLRKCGCPTRCGCGSLSSQHQQLSNVWLRKKPGWMWISHFSQEHQTCGYGSIPINTIVSRMNIHLPAILMFTRGTRIWHTAMWQQEIYFVPVIFGHGKSSHPAKSSSFTGYLKTTMT